MIFSVLVLGASCVISLCLKKSNSKGRRVLGHQVLTREGYDHCQLLDPEGKFLSYIDEKRFQWYLKKELATMVTEDSIKLNFMPKGVGGREDPYYSTKQLNRCVCCGTSDNYTKHHVIPKEFRIHFPNELKDHHSHDLLLLCAECHETYETHATILKKVMANTYGVPIHGFGRVENLELKKIQKLASTILGQRDNLKFPQERMREMINTVCEYLETDDLTDEGLKQVLSREYVDSSAYVTYGEAIVDLIAGKERNQDKIDEFSKTWRNHFVQVMKPKYLNEHWDKDRSLRK